MDAPAPSAVDRRSSRLTPAARAWILVALLWVVALLNYLDRQVIFSVFPLLQRDLKLTNVELGLLSTAFLWVYAACSPASGFLADRFGRVRVIVTSLLVWSAVTWVTGHARSASELLWARALMGISEAAYIPAALALINDYHDDRTRSLATGLHQSGIYFGVVVGGGAGGYLGQHYGWRLAFNLLGAIGILYAAVLWLGLRSTKPPERAARAPRFLTSAREALRLPGYPVMLAVFGLTSAAGWILFTWLPLYLYERFHMSLAVAGFTATFYYQAGSFAGILAGGVLADRWSRKRPRARVLAQAIGLAGSAPFLFLAGQTGLAWVLAASMLAVGLGRGFYDCNTMPVLCRVARPDLRATGYGIFNFVGTLVGGTTAVMAGALKNAIGLGGAVQLAAVVWLLAGLLLLRLPDAGPSES